MLETKLDYQLFKEDYDNSRTNSFGSNEAIIIMNPTQYTVAEDYESNLCKDTNTDMEANKLMDSLKIAFKENKKGRVHNDGSR